MATFEREKGRRRTDEIGGKGEKEDRRGPLVVLFPTGAYIHSVYVYSRGSYLRPVGRRPSSFLHLTGKPTINFWARKSAAFKGRWPTPVALFGRSPTGRGSEIRRGSR